MATQTWTTIQNATLAALAAAPPPYNVIPPDFATLFPQATSYAENRIYREIPMLAERQTVTGVALSITDNGTAPPQIDGISPVTIERFGISQSRVIYWYDRVSLDFLAAFWTAIDAGVDPIDAEWIGRYWAPYSDAPHGEVQAATAQMLFAPPILTGPFIPTFVALYPPKPISNANQTTYLSAVYPELLSAAIMVFLMRYLQRNSSATSDQPDMTMSFEADYLKLRDAAREEELRRRGLRPAVPLPPAPPQPVPAR